MKKYNIKIIRMEIIDFHWKARNKKEVINIVDELLNENNKILKLKEIKPRYKTIYKVKKVRRIKNMKKLNYGKIYYADIVYKNEDRKEFVPVVVIEADEAEMLVTVAPIITSDSELTNTQIVVKQFEELRPNSVIEVADIMTFDLARLKGYVGKLAEEQIEELDKVLETVR
ncbi:MAG: type II toxin-antitoxin system PemK/MazF family toxin [Bacilli bacterium]|nr:type II toxin-antitoxin system PemK/MazF family toxin [Bacilli bacterium]MBP3921289.1 type II toxin-antitoxin system PemK/MazF family toxin [Bacilli bacterium]